MFDIKLIREQPKTVKENLKKRQDPEILKRVDNIIKLDKEWRQVLQELNNSRKRKNEITQEIAKLKKEGGDIHPIVKEMQELPKKIKQLDDQLSLFTVVHIDIIH